MRGRVILVEARSLCWFPPIISLIKVLKSLDYDVVYVGLEYWKEDCDLLDTLGVEYRIHPWRRITKKQPCRRILKELGMRFAPVLIRRSWLWRQIRYFTRTAKTENVFVWSMEMLAGAYLGNRALRLGHRHIHTFFELGDEDCGPVRDFDEGRFYSSATIVECEENRARLLMEEKHLQQMPFVIPNKVFGHPRKRRMQIEDRSVRRIVEGWGERPVFLYQGWLNLDREDLISLLRWLAEGLPDAVVAIMTQSTEKAKALAERYPNVSVVPFIAPPDHLAVTSWATVGLAAYTGGSVYGLHPLNAVYCAPNKIFEYSGFGLPMLCNGIAGLKNTIAKSQSGICVDEWCADKVVAAGRTLLQNYNVYSNNSTAFFDSVDLKRLVESVLTGAAAV